MHYLNDHFYSYIYSQIWFSITESFVLIVITLALKKDFKDNLIFNIAAGISLSHAIQLLMDEITNIDSIGRNLFLGIGDVLTLFALLRRTRLEKLKTVIGSCALLLISFHVMFADDASTSF